MAIKVNYSAEFYYMMPEIVANASKEFLIIVNTEIGWLYERFINFMASGYKLQME